MKKSIPSFTPAFNARGETSTRTRGPGVPSPTLLWNYTRELLRYQRDAKGRIRRTKETFTTTRKRRLDLMDEDTDSKTTNDNIIGEGDDDAGKTIKVQVLINAWPNLRASYQAKSPSASYYRHDGLDEMTRKLGKSLTCGATMLRLRCGVWIEEISKEIIQVVKSEPDEVDQLEVATDVIRACKRDEFKDAKAYRHNTLLVKKDLPDHREIVEYKILRDPTSSSNI
ncbi:hypothetical protein B0O80DRAFT_496158 [Mortierella sp. GBAus27b]|nr:hypothetical protein B0O80DRAFT_496158 [Mortierella sp. GBAus27b]